jgi:glyoxylase-like metal-dependent hydrolase (beta-lactamase superfamily II)/rhodanese-related sulfurtransferase
MEMTFRQLNPHACRTYLLGNKNSNDVAIIDPVLDHFTDYLALLRSENLQLKYVIDTHTHADHISCGSALKDVTDCEYIMHKNAPAQCVTNHVDDGDKIDLLGIDVNVLYTPGHTMDSISLVFQDRIFTGDALFLDDGGAGRDDLPGGDPGSHWESLQKILNLPDHLVVYPAHEYRNREPSELSAQKLKNPHLKSRSKEEFIRYIEDLKLGPAEWMKDVLKANYACARDPKGVWIPVDLHACEVKGTLDYGVNEIDVDPISVKELNTKINSNNPPILLDVREEKELVSELGHLPGIKHIPINTLTAHLGELDEISEKEIVTVCRSGARANTAAQIMKQVGFNNVKVLDGGMLKWIGAGLPVSRKWDSNGS